LQQLTPGLVKEGALLTLVTVEDELVAVEPGDTREATYGIAVDIGSTTVAGYLVDLTRGITMTSAAVSNSQKEYGHDIMTRIAHCMREPEGLATLHARTLEDVNLLVKDLARRGRAALNRVYRMTVVGNPAMHHFFFRLPVESLGLAPYVPLYRDRVDFRPAAMGIELPAGCRATFLPAISGFVGADIVGMILATGLAEADQLTLAVDIGTNGESVLGTRDRFLCCSAPAGPAFEGAQIQDGMRAVPGAIDRVDVGEEIAVRVIGGDKPEGICGSGLIDAVAGLLDHGVIDSTGRLQDPADLPGSVPQAVRSRIHLKGEDRWVELVPAEATAHGRPIVVSQTDVRQLQLAKGAIAGSGRYLMQRLGVRPQDLHQVVLAGAFGSFVRAESAIRIGLIPPVSLKKVRGVGNAAGAGARLALASRAYLKKAEEIQRQAEYVELAGHDDF
ncbi:MAG TPA: ASKHA domain-containing protein, partial [Candidatus Methylomirabilis sp.]|nr:ASKHA domain-containing protein [Candidatus Methylomirabilis sp.]